MYRKAARVLVMFLQNNCMCPSSFEEWDDSIVLFKNMVSPSKSEFEQFIASVEFFFPRMRGRLLWARSISKGWAVSYVPKHTTPMGQGPARIVAAHMAAMGHGKLGIGIMIQRELGLRPSEMLRLCVRDIASIVAHNRRRALLALGARTGTKAKRSQAVILDEPMLLGLLAFALHCAPTDAPVFGYGYQAYRRHLKTIEARLGIQVSWTPHSLELASPASLLPTASSSPVSRRLAVGPWTRACAAISIL